MTLTYTLTNPSANTVTLTGVGFIDLPAGLLVATPDGLVGSCGGGTISAAAGATTISLTGATLPVGGSCSFSVSLTANRVGTYTITTAPDSDNGGIGAVAAVILTVTAAVPIPATGAATHGAIGIWGILLLFLGLALLLVWRRRRMTHGRQH